MVSKTVIIVSQIIAFGIVKAYRLVARIKVQAAKVPRDIPSKNVIVVSNHQSRLDGFMALSALPFRIYLKLLPVSPITSNLYLAHWYKRLPFYYIFGLYPARPLGRVPYGLSESQRRINRGFTLFFFPEGQRALKGTVRPRKGAALLALRNNMTVLPVSVAWSSRGPRRSVVVKYGEPFRLPGGMDPAKGAMYLIARVYDLLDS